MPISLDDLKKISEYERRDYGMGDDAIKNDPNLLDRFNKNRSLDDYVKPFPDKNRLQTLPGDLTKPDNRKPETLPGDLSKPSKGRLQLLKDGGKINLKNCKINTAESKNSKHKNCW